MKKNKIIKNIIKSKSYIGHKVSLNLSIRGLDPSISSFLLGTRKNFCIFDTKIIFNFFFKSLYVLVLIFKSKGHLLIVNTNPEFTKYIENAVKGLYNNNISYCNSKWVGGTLTNWKGVSKSILTYAKFSQRFNNFLYENNIHFPKYKKMKKCFQGFIKINPFYTKSIYLDINLIKKPDIILIINPKENKNVIEEANQLNIPVIALTDSNTPIEGITYPIPTNNISIDFIHFYFSWINRILYSIR